MSNGETNGANMYALGQHEKRPRWPRHRTYGSGVKVQKRSNFKQRQTAKLTMPTCRPWASMQKCPRWPRRQTYGSGVKKKRSNFKQRQIVKLTVPTCRPWANMQKCPRWPRRQTYGSGAKVKKVKFQTTLTLQIKLHIPAVSCRLWDFDPWLTPGCLVIPQMW